MSKGATNWLWIIIGIVAVLYLTGNLKFGGIPQIGQPVTPPTAFGQLVSLSVKGMNSLTGSAIAVNGEVWDSTDTQLVVETSIPSAITSVGTSFPNTFSGYVMLGNDNYESTTDRGDEIYYVKFPVTWSGLQGLTTRTINTYAEEFATGTNLWTFYDDNTAETTANITMGSGATYSSASVKLMSSSKNCTGNPAFNGQNPIAFCFNESTSGMFKTVKPKINGGPVPIPGFLSGQNVMNCYIMQTDALCDGAFKGDIDLYFEANSGKNPAETDYVFIIPVDKCYYKDDTTEWAIGYGDESDLSSDTDCGIPSRTAALQIWMT